MRLFSSTLLWVLSFLLIAPVTTYAGSFEVAPTTLSLPGDSVPSVFYITNRSDDPIVAQVEVYKWQQANNADQLDPTEDLIISPPMVRLQPGQHQTIRLMAKPDPKATGERTFRLIVSEIPDPTGKNPNDKIHMLLQFSVPVFVGATKDATAHLAWHGSIDNTGLKLSAQNTSDHHIKISRVSFETADKQPALNDEQAFHYILSGATYNWTAAPPVAVTSGQTLHVSTHDDATDTPITTSLVVQ